MEQWVEFFSDNAVTLREAYYSMRAYPLVDTEQLEEPNLITFRLRLAQHNSEFGTLLKFNTEMISKVAYSGCFPLGHTIGSKENLLVKLHAKRCVLQNIAENLHISRNIRKISKRYMITINGAYRECVSNISEYHKAKSWLFPKISQAFTELNQEQNPHPVKVVSVELWNISKISGERPTTIDELICSGAPFVAGEIGYIVGSSYTSLTGYHGESSSGIVQLVGLGKLLELCQYTILDFGMAMDYKLSLGATEIPIQQFLDKFCDARTRTPKPFPTVPLSVSDLIQNKVTL